MQAEEVEDIYTLTPVQEGMLFHVLADADPSLYREQGAAALRGKLEAAAFRRAWERVVERHTALRTSFRWEGLRRPAQVVHRRVDLPFDVFDWRDLAPGEAEARFAALLQEDRERPGPLTAAPLLRLALARVPSPDGEDRHRLLWSLHHLIHDAWSLTVILDEVLALYAEELGGVSAWLAPAPRYRNYVAWLKRRDPAASDPFWRRELAGFTAPTPLPGTSVADGRAVEASSGHRERYLSTEQTAVLAGTARGGITLATLLHAAWALLLARSAGRPEVLFGTVLAGRPAELPGSDRAVGLFISTLPLCLSVDPARPLSEWLRDLQARLLDLREHEATPLPRVLEQSVMPRGIRLFDSLVVVQNAFVDIEGRGAAGLTIESLTAAGHPDVPLLFRATPGPRLRLELLFDTAHLDPIGSEQLLNQAERLLGLLATADPEARLAAVDDRLSEDEERERAAGERRWREDNRSRLRQARTAVAIPQLPNSIPQEDR